MNDDLTLPKNVLIPDTKPRNTSHVFHVETRNTRGVFVGKTYSVPCQTYTIHLVFFAKIKLLAIFVKTSSYKFDRVQSKTLCKTKVNLYQPLPSRKYCSNSTDAVDFALASLFLSQNKCPITNLL